MVRGLFENVKMFYPPEGGSPIVFNLGFFGVGNGSGGFKTVMGKNVFLKNLKMFYPPEGGCFAVS